MVANLINACNILPVHIKCSLAFEVLEMLTESQCFNLLKNMSLYSVANYLATQVNVHVKRQLILMIFEYVESMCLNDLLYPFTEIIISTTPA